jgi:DNA adenine methylase
VAVKAAAVTAEAAEPAPFIKAVGGKTALLPAIHKRLPKTWGTYHEPFVGGGALFWSLCLTSGPAILSDMNARLIRTYQAIAKDVEGVIGHLHSMRKMHSEKFFYETRARFNGPLSDVVLAACFIYLNKTCFNGLHRENSDGKFNVPFGRYKNPAILDEERLRACSKALQGVDIWHEDFRAVEGHVVTGDLVYFDPPYVPITTTSDFTSYTAGGFRLEDQVTLRDLALRLKGRGVHVILSNSAAPAVEELYGKYFQMEKVSRRGTISSKANSRGAVEEYLIF